MSGSPSCPICGGNGDVFGRRCPSCTPVFPPLPEVLGPYSAEDAQVTAEFSDAKIAEIDPWKGDVVKALVVFAHGRGHVLVFQGPHNMADFDPQTEVYSGRSEGQSYGVFLVELVLEDDGPGDWPGTREVVLSERNRRLVTDAEWEAHVDGEWPWKEDGSEL
jgi:hypothetical protein